jgi:hypothetical protein
MIEVIFKIFLTDYIDFQGFITKRIQKPLLIEYNKNPLAAHYTAARESSLQKERNCMTVIVATLFLPLHNQFEGIVGALIIHIARFGGNANKAVKNAFILIGRIGRQKAGQVIHIVQGTSWSNFSTS